MLSQRKLKFFYKCFENSKFFTVDGRVIYRCMQKYTC